MADFTPDIQGPQSAWMIGRGAEAPDSLLGSIGHIVAGAADKGMDIFRQYKGNDLQGQEGQELSQAVRDYSAGQSGNPLVGQTTNPAESDKGYQAAKGEIDTHALAAQQGTPGSKQALMTRLSEITSRYASQNPYYAPQLQEYASKVLGFNSNAELVNSASRAEDFQRGLTEKSQTYLVDAATQAGGAHWNSDGTLDTKQTMLNGQELVVAKHKAELELQNAQLAAAQAKPTMSKDQTDDAEFRTVHPVAVGIANSATNGVFSQFAGLIGQAETGHPMDQPAIAANVAVQEQRAISQVTSWMDEHNIGNTTRTQIIADIKSRFEPIKAILGGDLSNAKQLTQAVSRIQDTYKIKFSQVAPHVYAASVIGGPQAAATLIQNYTSPAATTGAYRQNQQELNRYFNAPSSFDDTMRGVNGMMQGSYNPAQEPDRQKAKAVVTNAMPVLDAYSARPHKLDDKESKSFGNLVRTTSAAATASGDDASIINAGSRLTRPGVVQGVINYAKNPANANDAPKTLEAYGTYLARTQAVTAKALTAGGDQRIVRIDTSQGTHRVGASVSIHFSATTDAKGLAVPHFEAKDNQGRPIELTGAEKRQVMQQNPSFGRTMSVYNQSVAADEAIKRGLGEAKEKPQKTQAKAEVSGDLMQPARLDAFIAAHGGKIDAAIAAAPNDDVAQALADRYAHTKGLE